jgi:hypothetical protein
MTEADATPTPNRRAKRTLALVESADSGWASSGDTTAPPMAVSIAGVSTACSKDALRSSAESVRRNLTPE